MSPLHISKVAVGCATFDALRKRQEARASGGTVPIVTRFRPKRADELVGGSIFWIVKHRLAARQTIIGFRDGADRRTIIDLDAELVPVRAVAKRAHQGWRYLAAEDAPHDFDGEDDAVAAMPPGLAIKLAALGLI
jgi:hypothetical protein